MVCRWGMRITSRSGVSCPVVVLRMLRLRHATIRASTPQRAADPNRGLPTPLPQAPPFAVSARVPRWRRLRSLRRRVSRCQLVSLGGAGCAPSGAAFRHEQSRQKFTKPIHQPPPPSALSDPRHRPRHRLRRHPIRPPSPSAPPPHPTPSAQLARSRLRSETNAPCFVSGGGSSVPVPSATPPTVVGQSA